MKTSRRKFIKSASAAAAAFTIVPRHVLGGSGFTAPSEKLVVAGIGAAGWGTAILRVLYQSGKVEVPYLCEVHKPRIATSLAFRFQREGVPPDEYVPYYKTAKYYKDFREMLVNEHRNIDAVYVATPEHNHAIQALAAMQLGKHVYVEKSLTHDIWEARVLTDAAKRYKVVTQMGNQGASGEGPKLVRKWYDAGVLGEVGTVYSWSNRPLGPPPASWPSEKAEIPKELDWDLWLGTAPYKDYVIGMPRGWSKWWDYSTGALGGSCHHMEVAFSTLGLQHVKEVQASTIQIREGFQSLDSHPIASHVTMRFDKTPRTQGPVTLHWMNGGIMPSLPEELGPNQPFGMMTGGRGFNGTLIVGTEKKVLLDMYGDNPRLLPTSQQVEPSPYPFDMKAHLGEWVDACLAGYGKKRLSSSFDVAGPLTESLLVGNLAIRGADLRNEHGFPGQGVKMQWDHEAMRVTNFDAVNQFVKREYRPGWEVKYKL